MVEHEHEWIAHYRIKRPDPDSYVCKNCSAVVGPDFKPLPTAMELSTKKQTSSAHRWWGKSVIYGKEDEHATPYMTRYWVGRLRLHIFHRGDQDPDCHDHPWDFWTFPFTPYVEEVVTPDLKGVVPLEAMLFPPERYRTRRQIVPAFRLAFRPATHTHRVLNRARRINPKVEKGHTPDERGNYYVDAPGPIVTLVWRTGKKRKWGFLKNRDGKWCWVDWKSYVFGGGKSAPCE